MRPPHLDLAHGDVSGAVILVLDVEGERHDPRPPSSPAFGASRLGAVLIARDAPGEDPQLVRIPLPASPGLRVALHRAARLRAELGERLEAVGHACYVAANTSY